MSMIQRLTQLLANYPEIQLAMVYGSFASGKESPKSDIDLAIAGDLPFSADFKVNLINALSADLGREVDLLDLQSASGTVLKEALTQGQIIKKADSDLLAQIIKRMLFDEADFQSVRRRYSTQKRKKSFDVA